MESPTANATGGGRPITSASWAFHHHFHRRGSKVILLLLSCLYALCGFPVQAAAAPGGKSVNICTAVVSVLYREPSSGRVASDGRVDGRYSLRSPVEAEHGRVVHLVSELGRNDGCTPAVNTPGHGHWIALVQRGGCRFADKIHNAALLSNASAVVVYDDREDDELITMNHEGRSKSQFIADSGSW